MRTLILTSMFWSIGSGCNSQSSSIDFPQLPAISTPKTLDQNLGTKGTVKRWDVALMGEIRGELEPCGCPTLPYGGFVRRESALQSMASSTPLFQLDAGEMLLKGFFSNKETSSKDRARLMAELSKDVGVDAWAVGPSDLMAVGLEELQSMTGPPRISATWVDDANKYIFDPFIILNKSDVNMAVIGLSAKPTDPNWQVVTTLSAIEALDRVLPTIPSTVDLIAVLGSMDDEEITPLLDVYTDIQLFLTTEGANYDEPHINTGTPVIEAPKQGRFVQMVHIRHNANERVQPISGLTDSEWRQWLSLKDNAPEHPLHAKVNTIGSGEILIHTELIPLSATFDNPTGDVQAKISDFAVQRIEQSQKVAEQPPTKTEPGYAASGRCAQCHSAEMAKWSFSNHARAWESLLSHPTKGSTSNPECIGCHSTGFGEVGGFGEPSVQNIRKFKAVQCEACHGPMKGHPQDKSIESIPISEATCLGCHDEANSPDFEYTDYLHRSTCQSK